MKCNACSKFLTCDKKECDFKRIRGVKIRKEKERCQGTTKKNINGKKKNMIRLEQI